MIKILIVTLIPNCFIPKVTDTWINNVQGWAKMTAKLPKCVHNTLSYIMCAQLLHAACSMSLYKRGEWKLGNSALLPFKCTSRGFTVNYLIVIAFSMNIFSLLMWNLWFKAGFTLVISDTHPGTKVSGQSGGLVGLHIKNMLCCTFILEVHLWEKSAPKTSCNLFSSLEFAAHNHLLIH